MGFLAPWMLGALALGGLPVWLHLLRQHKTTPVPFSSLMFFERRTTTSTRQRRLRYYTLLAMRLIAILLLALAFAQPYWERKVAAGSGRKITVAAIDTSYSMRRGGALETAKRDALALAGRINAGSPGIVLAFGASAREVGQKAEDSATFRNSVNAVIAGDEKSSYGELSRVLRGLAEAHRMPLDVYVFTDIQRTGLPGRFSDLQMPAGSVLNVSDVAPKELNNYTVESVTPPGRIFDTAKATVRATIAARHAPAATKTVALVADGNVLSRQAVTLTENGRATVEFHGLETGYGFHRGEVKLEDASDAFPSDDSFRFAIERSDPRRVLLLHPAEDSRSALYFRAALGAAAPNAFQVDAVSYAAAAAPSLSGVSFVVLANPGALGHSLESALGSYVRQGGAVWIAAGSYTGGLDRLPLAGLKVKESRVASRTREMYQTVASREPLHPVMERAEGIESAKFYQVVSLEPGPKTKVLARAADATPIFLEQAEGEGRILMMASPLDNLGNNLPLHPAFIPLVERAAQYLSRQQESTGVVRVGEGVELRATSDRATGVEVLDPRGARALSLEESSKATTFAPGEEGYYEIRRANGRSSLVAVNADRRESDLERMETETLDLWKSTGEPEPGAETGPGGMRTERNSPWWWMLLIVLFLTLAEAVAASRYIVGSGAGAAAQPELVGKEAA